MKTPLIALVLGLFSPYLSQARWALPHEADAAIERNDLKINLHKDGTAEIDNQIAFSILKETARERWGTIHLAYSPKNSTYKVTDTSTRNGDQVFPVDERDIVDSAVQATEHGFDEQRQVVISFPHVRVGSLLSYSTHEKIHHAFVKDVFSWRYSFGESSLFNKTDVTITSERPLYFDINDPDGDIAFQDQSQPPRYTYHFYLKKPVLKQLLEEERPYLPEAKKTWVAFSTAKTYPEMFQNISARYEEILAKPLPKIFRPVIEAAKKEKDFKAQLNTVTSMVSDTIRYMGDWRAVDGGMIPHSLDEIAGARHGDCKDITMVLVKILREMGFQADPALVERGGSPKELPKVPHINMFNHAIATVKLNSERLWLDGTNFLSDAGGVQDDIAFRDALILNFHDIHLENIGWNGPEKNLNLMDTKADMLSSDMMTGTLDVTLTGFQAYPLVGQDLRVSKEQIENNLLERYYYRSDLIDYHLSPLDLKSRIVSPVEYKIQMKKFVQNFQTSVGTSLPVSHLDLSYIYKLDVKNRVSKFILGLPATYRLVFSLDHFNYRGKSIQGCKVSNAGLDYEMKVKYLPKALTVVSELRIKKRYLDVEELQSPEFKEFQSKLKDCAREKYFVYK